MAVAKNGKPGGGRVGQVRDRSQVRNPATGQWTKRDTVTGRFMDGKQDGTPLKGVRKEK
ncbi:MAG: hypothetical protein IT340_12585 [Chloroflexi bacterium]|nr:hypothetical protein [Chloroflexota bacterium]